MGPPNLLRTFDFTERMSSIRLIDKWSALALLLNEKVPTDFLLNPEDWMSRVASRTNFRAIRAFWYCNSGITIRTLVALTAWINLTVTRLRCFGGKNETHRHTRCDAVTQTGTQCTGSALLEVRTSYMWKHITICLFCECQGMRWSAIYHFFRTAGSNCITSNFLWWKRIPTERFPSTATSQFFNISNLLNIS